MGRPEHIASLDGLRGLAAALVVMAHIGLVFPSLAAIHLPVMGSEAVGLFFALSGFLMAYLYGGQPVTRSTVLDFLVSRFARIYPVYLVAVVVVMILSIAPGLDYIQPIQGMKDFVRHVVLLGSSGVFWSVPPEIQFYLFFPVLWLCLGQPRQFPVLIAVLMALVAIDGLLGLPGPGILLPSKLPYFVFGAVAGRLHGLWGPASRSPFIGLLALLLPVLFMSYRYLLPTVDPGFWGVHSAFASAIIVALVAWQAPLSERIFASAPLRFLGAISFSLYLFHVPAMFLARHTLSGLLPESLVIPLTFVIAGLAAWFVHVTVEMPARQWLVGYWRKSGLRSGLVDTPTGKIEVPASN